MDSLGSRMKELRRQKGLTQTELGNLAGIHHTNIGRIENKKVVPQADILYLIAKNLNTTVEWLLTGQADSPDMLPDQNNFHFLNGSDPILFELLELYGQFTESEKKELLKFAKFIVFDKTAEKTTP
jgi:Predicted transcriptional regulators